MPKKSDPGRNCALLKVDSFSRKRLPTGCQLESSAKLAIGSADNALLLRCEATTSQRPNRYVIRLLAVNENTMP
jgi:hypothetical protein